MTATPDTRPDTTRPADGGRLLRTVLRLDAAASGLLGAIATGAGAAGTLAAPLGVTPALLVAVGLFLLAYAAGLVALAAPRRIPRAGARAVVGLNLAWVVASGLFALLGGLTALGAVVVLAQALAVALLAELQYAGLRRV